MNSIAAIRPDEWELPLYVHLIGAFALTATLVLTGTLLFSAWRSGDPAAMRRGLRSLLFGVVPSWIVLRGSAEWLSDKEGYADLDEPPSWIDIGYITTDLGLLLIIASGVLAWRAARKASGEAGGSGTARAAGILLGVLVVLNVFAIWAMTTKPV